MFERFTKDAKIAVVSAQEVARETHSATIGVEHLALATLQAGGAAARALADAGVVTGVAIRRLSDRARGAGLDEEALAALGIDLETVSRAADETFGDGALERADATVRRRGRKRGHLPFTKEAKKALELALREALRLGDKEIADRHLLLAILRADATIAEVLTAGVDRGAVRRSLETSREAA